MRYVADIDDSFRVGGLYEDCGYHPCLCVVIDEDDRDIQGISLMDGSGPRSCDLDHCGPQPLTVAQAVAIRADLAGYIERRASGLTIEDSLGLRGLAIDPASWDRRQRSDS
jgi:hypothetical protein